MNYWNNALIRCEVPISADLDMSPFHFNLLDRKAYAHTLHFMRNVKKPNRLALLGDKYYEWSIRICRTSLALDITRNLKFYFCNMLYNKFVNIDKFDKTLDTLVICNINNECNIRDKQLFLSILQEAITLNMNIMISAKSVDDIHNTCSSMWNIIDSSFNVVKV